MEDSLAPVPTLPNEDKVEVKEEDKEILDMLKSIFGK